MSEFIPGVRVRLKDNPQRMGIVGQDTEGSGRRLRLQVVLFDGTEDHFPPSALELVNQDSTSPTACFKSGRYALVNNLRSTITYNRLSGRLANLIYSLNTTNTDFYAHQFKPVLQFLDSPNSSILIADEVGLGKTIEAGLIWTELRARVDARRLLVLCPAVLRNKWREELLHRFDVKAEIVDANELLDRFESVQSKPNQEFALIASMQGLRPPQDYESLDNQRSSAKLARFLENAVQSDSHLMDLLIIDEAHYLRNEGTKTNKLGQLLREHAASLVLLSATPIQLGETDLFNLLRLLDESIFPDPYLFQLSMSVTRPIVQLRDTVLQGLATRKSFCEAIQEALANDFLSENKQLAAFLKKPPSNADLKDPAKRSEIANRLDKVHPLSKLVTRTLKRDVQENRVLRAPSDFRAPLNEIETRFYNDVTHEVRDYCEKNGLLAGFILTMPQRQMVSSMPAACRAWQEKITTGQISGFSETLSEITDELDDAPIEEPSALNSMIENLVSIAQEAGGYEKLKEFDSKYTILADNLRKYSLTHAGEKVVLFSFFRHTLSYLHERLTADGFSCIVLQGGSDKKKTLDVFSAVDGPQILLSSEVGSEGIDLQFSSLLINYDLPWNPMRIEQRIGRIDRLGQKADKILIWNLMYANTIDERIYDRLLDRLDIFKQAFGSMEDVLGGEIQKMTRDLFRHQLTPDEELRRIEQSTLALEAVQQKQQELETRAPDLVAHGDFIINKVRAAKELGRYIQSEDLYAYVTDYICSEFQGTRLVHHDSVLQKYDLELSIDLRIQLADFIQKNNLQQQTGLLTGRPLPIVFENAYQGHTDEYERIHQEHPLVRFVTEQLSKPEHAQKRYPISAVQLNSDDFDKGIYVFLVSRWSFSGAETQERLIYTVQNLDAQAPIDDDLAEKLVNIAAINGTDWTAAGNLVDKERVVDVFFDCKDLIQDRFKDSEQAMLNENNDRVNLMIKIIVERNNFEIKKQQARINEALTSGHENKIRLIPAVKGKIKKNQQLVEQRIAELQHKKKLEAANHFVTAGVIWVGD